jgi:periplasmic protein TonB
MENTNFLKRDLDDIVFEGRNQNYGAYVIRKIYQNHLKRASIFGFAFFALIVASPSIAENMKPKDKFMMDPVVLNTLPEIPKVDIPKPPEPPKPELPKPVIATQQFTPPVVKEDNEVKEPDNIPKMEDITAAVAAVTQEGDKGVLAPDFVPAPPIGAGEGDGDKKVTKEEDTDVTFMVVEQSPEFINGIKAMYQFLSNNMKYPSVARENNIEGTVYVGFVVGKDGTIRDVKVKRGIAGGCNEEAIRVVELMPKWNPGKQNGRPVSVAYTIPIKFKLD